MFKTIFIIIVSMTVSTLTTAGLLYRYTLPAATPAVTVADVSRANPVAIANDFVPPQVKPLGAESNDIAAVVSYDTVVTAVPGSDQTHEIKTVNPDLTTDQQQRSFNHQLLVSDISSLSQKLEQFNDFLSGEVQRLKNSKTKKQP